MIVVLHSSAKSESAPKEMSKNHSSLLPQVRRGTRVLSRGKNAWDDSSRLIALLIAPHLPFHPTKEASSPPVSMATSRKRATGRYHFHRRGKGECGSHHLPRFSRGFLAPAGAGKNAPREKKSGVWNHFGNTSQDCFGAYFKRKNWSRWFCPSFEIFELINVIIFKFKLIGENTKGVLS